MGDIPAGNIHERFSERVFVAISQGKKGDIISRNVYECPLKCPRKCRKGQDYWVNPGKLNVKEILTKHRKGQISWLKSQEISMEMALKIVNESFQ